MQSMIHFICVTEWQCAECNWNSFPFIHLVALPNYTTYLSLSFFFLHLLVESENNYAVRLL